MTLILLVLLSSAEVDARGTTGEPPQNASLRRNDARVRASAGGGATFAIANEFPSGGLSFLGELGLTVIDRLSLSAQLEVGMALRSVLGSIGLRLGLAIGDHFGLGVGAAFTAWRPTGSWGDEFYGLTFPVSLSFTPTRRTVTDCARRGVLVALQIAPGSTLPQLYQGEPRPPAAGLVVTLSAAYAIW